MFHAIEVERLCINCLRLIYVILLVNLKILVFMYLPKCLFARVSCGAWPGARVCNCAVARAGRVHPWLRPLKAKPTQIQVALIFLNVLNEIYL